MTCLVSKQQQGRDLLHLHLAAKNRREGSRRIDLLPSSSTVLPTSGASSMHRLLPVASVHVLTHLVASHGSEASAQHRVQVATADLAANATHELNNAAASTHQHKDCDDDGHHNVAAAILSKAPSVVATRLHPLLIATLLLEAPLLEATRRIAPLQHNDIAQVGDLRRLRRCKHRPRLSRGTKERTATHHGGCSSLRREARGTAQLRCYPPSGDGNGFHLVRCQSHLAHHRQMQHNRKQLRHGDDAHGQSHREQTMRRSSSCTRKQVASTKRLE